MGSGFESRGVHHEKPRLYWPKAMKAGFLFCPDRMASSASDTRTGSAWTSACRLGACLILGERKKSRWRCSAHRHGGRQCLTGCAYEDGDRLSAANGSRISLRPAVAAPSKGPDFLAVERATTLNWISAWPERPARCSSRTPALPRPRGRIQKNRKSDGCRPAHCHRCMRQGCPGAQIFLSQDIQGGTEDTVFEFGLPSSDAGGTASSGVCGCAAGPPRPGRCVDGRGRQHQDHSSVGPAGTITRPGAHRAVPGAGAHLSHADLRRR